MKNWERLTKVNQYLEANRNKGIKAFEELIKRAKQDAAELVVLSFTYEHMEAYAKVNGNYQLYDNLFGILSETALDDLTRYDYDEENSYQDYEYWKFNSLVWELIELWTVNCFELAHKKEGDAKIKYYYKHNHDSLEILELNTCKRKFEKSEFEIYIQNNERNVLELLG